MNRTEEKDTLCSRIIRIKPYCCVQLGLTLQKDHLKNAKFKNIGYKRSVIGLSTFYPDMSTIHAASPQNHPYFPTSLISHVPLCIPRTLYKRSAWILILIESNMLETERLRKKCITSALDSPPAIIYVVH